MTAHKTHDQNNLDAAQGLLYALDLALFFWLAVAALVMTILNQ